MLIDFMEWLNNEIEDLRNENQNRMYSSGKFSEAIRIRAHFLMMIQTVGFEKIAEEMCDHFCKFPEAYDHGREDDHDRMIEEKCNKCPLCNLLTILSQKGEKENGEV